MSSCDGVRPIVVRAGSVHPEGVTYTPHIGSSQPPGTGRPSQQLAGNRPKNRVTWKVRLSFRVAAGITFQLQCRRDVGPPSKLSGGARLCLLVAVALLAGRWCFWRLLVFLAGLWVSGCFFSLFRGRRPEDRSVGVYNLSGLCRELRHEEVSFHLLLLLASTRPAVARLSATRPSASQSLVYERLHSYPTNF